VLMFSLQSKLENDSAKRRNVLLTQLGVGKLLSGKALPGTIPGVCQCLVPGCCVWEVRMFIEDVTFHWQYVSCISYGHTSLPGH
jgi:hypothetical protein